MRNLPLILIAPCLPLVMRPKAVTLGRMEFEWDPVKAARNLHKHRGSR